MYELKVIYGTSERVFTKLIHIINNVTKFRRRDHISELSCLFSSCPIYVLISFFSDLLCDLTNISLSSRNIQIIITMILNFVFEFRRVFNSNMASF